MNPAQAAVDGLVWLLEHANIVKAVGEALAAGAPKEAVEAAIRGLIVDQSEATLREEFEAANARNAPRS